VTEYRCVRDKSGATFLPETEETHKGRAVSNRWSKATLGMTADDIAHTWTESVQDSVHGTDRGDGPRPDGGEGGRFVAGLASRGGFGSVSVRFSLRSQTRLFPPPAINANVNRPCCVSASELSVDTGRGHGDFVRGGFVLRWDLAIGNRALRMTLLQFL
jgi:hypothetical protein